MKDYIVVVQGYVSVKAETMADDEEAAMKKVKISDLKAIRVGKKI